MDPNYLRKRNSSAFTSAGDLSLTILTDVCSIQSHRCTLKFSISYLRCSRDQLKGLTKCKAISLSALPVNENKAHLIGSQLTLNQSITGQAVI